MSEIRRYPELVPKSELELARDEFLASPTLNLDDDLVRFLVERAKQMIFRQSGKVYTPDSQGLLNEVDNAGKRAWLQFFKKQHTTDTPSA